MTREQADRQITTIGPVGRLFAIFHVHVAAGALAWDRDEENEARGRAAGRVRRLDDGECR